MKFTKMHGCGNDYIYVNCFEEKVEDPSAVAIKVSDVRKGIGSDGLILITPSENAPFMMRIFNADGSEGKMCGNGIRCVGKYIYDHGMCGDKTEIDVDTLSGVKKLKLFVNKDTNKVETVRVYMGKAIFKTSEIPFKKEAMDYKNISAEISESENYVKANNNVKVSLLDRDFEFTVLSMGNPHTVTYVEDTAEFEVEKYGKVSEFLEIYPERVNTEFAHVLNEHEVNMRVWERGSGETHACGTGACATAVSTIVNKMAKSPVTVHMLGGDVVIEYDEETRDVYMTGPAETVCEGEYFY